ncbi:hypothetical protein N7486_005087 [Penicillium sp. IBT 16267x]|nr:hypothetical protein N7486_005087 [Penicillium sp. IBT 16267x]
MTETKMQLEDWLDDLCVRFIINLPREELESVERICFQVEEAQWFYEDFIRPLDPALPSLSLKAFALRIFQHCPLMSQWSNYHHQTAFSEFLAYKTRVPVRGAILLNEDMDEVVLVKGWKKGANWSFPRGKINKGEKDLDCAIREVYEETGFDVRKANLVEDDDAVKHIEISMREQHMRLYVFRGVPRDTYFEPRTRKEISKIEWYKLSELPTLKKNKQEEGLAVANANKFYMVAPFLHPLKKWISQQKKHVSKAHGGAAYSQNEGYTSVDENGFQTSDSTYMSAAAHGVPSDLPEVTSVKDVSSHLKRLLNINGGVSTPAPIQAAQPAQPAAVDQSKSNALLELLRQGSQDPVSQVRNAAAAPSTLPMAQAPHLAPNFFPGFPQQQQHMAPTNFMQQTSAQPFYDGLPRTNMQHAQFPPVSHPELSGSPAVQQIHPMHTPSYQNRHPVFQANTSAPQRQGMAPFQRTGDPQFSQQAQPPQTMEKRVPPASKLPPPTLNSHKLALLDVFKNEAFRSPRSPQVATLAAPEPGHVKVRKTSQHQDSLLNLFKGSATSPAPPPVELSGNPVPPAPAAPAEVQILQRAQQQAIHNTQRGPGAYKPGQTTATVSGPLNMPQFDAIAKSAPRKGPNGPSRKNNFNRRDHQQTQQLSSPITILPRPQSSKRDASISGLHMQTTQPPHQSPAPQPQAPEPIKPFQPQILRRSEKIDYESLMVKTPKTENMDRRSPAPLGVQTQTPTQTAAPQNNFNRRPSQTSAQKEALLSLFGKPGLSPSPTSAAQPDHHAMAVSGLVSPLSSRHFPSSGEPLSRHGTPSETDMIPNRIASPNHKAFLLGYLQSAAKGDK